MIVYIVKLTNTAVNVPAVLDKLTYPVNFKQMIKAIIAPKALNGTTANNTPKLVATAFPPLNFKNAE